MMTRFTLSLAKNSGDRRLLGRFSAIPNSLTRIVTATDFIYKYMKASAERRDMEFWNTALVDAGKSINSESTPFSAKLNSGISMKEIFTVDPENIKAVLSPWGSECSIC